MGSHMCIDDRYDTIIKKIYSTFFVYFNDLTT